MLETEINLTQRERKALDEISRRTGKTHKELIHQAVERLILEFQTEERRVLMRKAKGMWKDRQLPRLEDIRQEWNRF
jgi:hypothetical protein